MKRLFQMAFVVALAYITAFYTSNKEADRNLLDFDFNFDLSEFFEDDYGYEFDENADINVVIADGKYYLEQKEYYTALEYFQQATLIDTSNSESVYYIAKCYQGLTDFHQAELNFRKILTMDSIFFSEAYLGLGTIAFSGTKFDSSFVYFSKAIEIKPDNDEAYYQRADNYLNLKDTASAIKDFEYAIYLNPNSAAYIYRLAKFYFKKKEYKKAEELYTKCLLIENLDYQYSCLFDRGICYYYLKNYELAINSYTQALEIKNTDAYIYYNIAISYDNLSDTANALENYELFTISTSDYNSTYDYCLERIKTLKGEKIETDSIK